MRYQDVQGRFLENLLGGLHPLKVALFLLGAATLALVPALLSMLGRRQGGDRDPADRQYRRFCRTMAAAGCPRHRGEAPRAYARRCARRFPDRKQDIEAITALYEACRYRRRRLDVRSLRRRVAAFRPPRVRRAGDSTS